MKTPLIAQVWPFTTQVDKAKILVFAAISCFLNTSSAGVKRAVNITAAATLNSLTFNPSITKNTVSGPGFRDYVATVSGSLSSIKEFPVTTDPAATVKGNGEAVHSGSSSSAILLAAGDNIISPFVTASDGITTNTYKTTITRLASNVATLKSITYSPGITTTVVTGPDYKDYTAAVNGSVASIKVTPIATDPSALVKVNGTTVIYGASSVAIPLIVGDNMIATVVTAPDGVTTKTYRVTIKREAPALLSSLSFDPSITKTTVTGTHFRDYTATVPNTISSIKVIPVTNASLLAVKVNGVAVASGSASAAIPLNVGNNTLTTIVTEADGVTSNTYSTVITRQKSAVATLNSLNFNPRITKTTVSGPDFRDYTAIAPNQVSSIKVIPVVTDPAATVRVNGTVVASGGSSASIPLLVGSNTITTVVTAADGVTANTYKTIITRAASAVADLRYVDFDFYPTEIAHLDTTNYQQLLRPSPSDRKVTVSVVPRDKTASVKINGVAVSYSASTGLFSSRVIGLKPGRDTITVAITSANGVNTKIYKTPIYLQTLVYLVSFSFDPAVTLTPVTGSNYRNFTASVPNSLSSVKVLFKAADDSLTNVTVNGVAEISGVKSGAFPLAVGSNIIKIIITSKSGLESDVYTTVITRAAPPVAHVMAYMEDKQQSPIAPGVVVHANLSPNGDGAGDKLLIDGIAAYPENKLMIINRSGALVYLANGYDNALKVFDGHSSVNGKLQQPGTYFYSFDYKADGQLKHKTGYIIIKY